jgi:hypothetical protein
MWCRLLYTHLAISLNKDTGIVGKYTVPQFALGIVDPICSGRGRNGLGGSFPTDRNSARKDMALTKFGDHNSFKGAKEMRTSPALSIARRMGDKSLNVKGSFDKVFVPMSLRRVNAAILFRKT